MSSFGAFLTAYGEYLRGERAYDSLPLPTEQEVEAMKLAIKRESANVYDGKQIEIRCQLCDRLSKERITVERFGSGTVTSWPVMCGKCKSLHDERRKAAAVDLPTAIVRKPRSWWRRLFGAP